MTYDKQLIPEPFPVFNENGDQIGSLFTDDKGTQTFIPAAPVFRNVKDRLFKFIFGHPDH